MDHTVITFISIYFLYFIMAIAGCSNRGVCKRLESAKSNHRNPFLYARSIASASISKYTECGRIVSRCQIKNGAPLHESLNP